jgi:hypothetical protein
MVLMIRSTGDKGIDRVKIAKIFFMAGAEIE